MGEETWGQTDGQIDVRLSAKLLANGCVLTLIISVATATTTMATGVKAPCAACAVGVDACHWHYRVWWGRARKH